MCLFVLCVACLKVFVNCLVKQFAMCVGVVAILLLNVIYIVRIYYRKFNKNVVHICTIFTICHSQ